MARSTVIPAVTPNSKMPTKIFERVRAQPPTTHPELWVTVDEAAALLGCSVKTVQRRAANGDLTVYRGPVADSGPSEVRTRYLRADVAHYAAQHTEPKGD